MKKNKLDESQKIILAGFILFILVLSIISTTSNLLKNDAEETHKNIANIYNKTFSQDINNSIYNIELFTNGLKMLYIGYIDNKKIDEYISKYLRENPVIRSINILNENKIVKSTNPSNINLIVSTDNYYPKPLFKKDILQFGNPYNGRDFSDGQKIDNTNEYMPSKGYFLPILKLIDTKEKDITILIVLNVEALLSKFNDDLEKKSGHAEILDLNSEVLISTDSNIKIGKKILNDEILNTLKEKNSYLGIEKLNALTKDIISIENIQNYPLSLLLRFDYASSLKNWEEKRFNFLLIITILLVVISILILIFIVKSDKNKRTEISLHKAQIENQKRFKDLFEQSNLYSMILNKDGKINKMNNSVDRFLKEDYVNTYIKDIDCLSDKDKLWFKNILKNPCEVNEKEITITNKDFQKIDLEVSVNIINIEDNLELVFLGKDITQKKIDEKVLRQAYQVFKNTHDGIIITDENVNIINVNDAFIKCTGYELYEVLNKNPKILKSDKNSNDFYQDMWKEIKEKNYWDGEIVNRKKDGTNYIEWLTISAVYNDKNELVNYIGIFSDISKQKNQEEIIKEKERMLFNQSKMASMGEMLGNIAHQWRQPLSVISLAAGAIKISCDYKEIYKDEEIKDFVDSISSSTNYLSETIDDFRNFFIQDTTNEKFDSLEVINKTLKLLSSNFKYKQIEIVFRKVETNTIMASENEFKQVLMNILNNAKDALVQNDKIKNKYIFIDINFDENDVIIDICDNAGGIDEDIIEKVFEPYFTTKHKSIGTGIGLYMAEEIITKHMNGALFVCNKKYFYNDIEYEGANFSIKIPLYKD